MPMQATAAQLAPFKECLRTVSFLTEADCALFEPHLRVRTLTVRDYLLTAGKVCLEIGYINKGCFRTYYLSEGKEINTQFAFEGDFVVDYDSFLNQKASPYYIQPLEDAEVVTFNLAALQQAYNQSQRWERFGRVMAEEAYRRTTARVESFLFMGGEERYVDLLTHQPHIFERVPLYHIASYLGMERESLSRLRRKVSR